jgi:hypothetical protein
MTTLDIPQTRSVFEMLIDVIDDIFIDTEECLEYECFEDCDPSFLTLVNLKQ